MKKQDTFSKTVLGKFLFRKKLGALKRHRDYNELVNHFRARVLTE